MDNIKDKLYSLPKPPPRTRTKPLQVICVGPPRSATESLGLALHKLGLPTYHGWDIIFEENPGYIQEWAHLARRKWKGDPDGDVQITTAEFDALIGHVEAVVDICASFFAAELIQAYPEAKIILNTRKDLDAWHQSATKTIVHEIEDRVFLRTLRLFNAHFFWCWEMFIVNGFAGKTPPDEPFPKTNDPMEFKKRVERLVKRQFVNAIRNMLLLLGSFVFLFYVTVTATGLRVKDRE
ncbi:hypothetical protein PHISCL_00940 [Aspergillus sclerotialis]|uniref:P-loop containing nucleoside triphosphate hydrolase protein n=1 Tax=Aspergillus sclerotialis TaxID=2070753 RepID=A0A3A2ZU62_9EURO|nr:hypothetical protein PHISCL_00940 [Aspergillus sclerotialis]